MRTSIIAMLVLAPFAAHAAVVPVTTCGQVVTGVGQLAADLDCSATADEAVKLSGRLLLNGFTITGNPASDVVRCQTGSCRIDGPGTITGGSDGVRSDRSAKLFAVIVTGNAGDGVRTDGSAKVTGGSVTGNGGDGVSSKTSAKVTDATVSGNTGTGVGAKRSATVKRSTVSGNGAEGIDADANAKAQDSTVTGNGLDGLRGLKVGLKDSTATGNGVSAACGVTDECADVASERTPRISAASSCGTSRNTDVGGTWGVCTND